MTGDRKYRATVSVEIMYHGVPCRDTTDASQQVISRLPIKQIGDIVSSIGCDDVRVTIGYVTMYSNDEP
jgi:hypothetical protein